MGRLKPAPGRRLSIVRACLDLRIPGYDPGDRTLETRAVRALIHRGLPAPRQQHSVRIDGRRYLLDLAYPDEMVAIEADSWRFHGPFRSAFEYDRSRRNALVAHGWAVLQFTSRMSADEMANRAEATLARQREILRSDPQPA